MMKVNEITLYRGNSAVIELNISVSGEKYTLQDGDTVEFAVKSSSDRNADKIISKILTDSDYNENNSLQIEISPSDTISLQPFTYCYDVGITFADGSFYTVIPPSAFRISATVTEVIT